MPDFWMLTSAFINIAKNSVVDDNTKIDCKQFDQNHELNQGWKCLIIVCSKILNI